MSLDKNIAAIMRPDARTVQVVFPDRDESLSPNVKRPAAIEQALERAYNDAGRVHLSMPKAVTPPPLKVFTYVTNLDLQVDEMVVAVLNGRFRVGCVAAVDKQVEISPSDNIQYLWIVAKVDFSDYEQNMALNKTLEDQLATARKRSVQHTFRQQVLDQMEDGLEKDAMLKLLGITTTSLK